MRWPEAVVPGAPVVPDIDGLAPALEGLVSSLARALVLPLGAAILAFYAARVAPHAAVAAVVVVVLTASGVGSASWSLATFGYEFGAALLSAAITAAAIAWLYRDNVAAYLLTGFLTGAVRGGLRLLDHPAYAEQGWILLGCAAAALLGAGLLALRTPKTNAPF